MFKKCMVLLLFVVMVLTFSFTVAAEEWPDEPIRLVVAYGSGGSTDIVTRHIGRELEKKLGVNVIVENRSGGAGTVAASLNLNQPANGNHLVTLASAASFIAPHMQEDITFNPVEDFTHISGVGGWRYALVVKDDAPWETFEEFIEYSKENPGVSYATSGVGNSQDLVMRYLMVTEDIDWKISPYQTGTEGVAAVVGGHADAYAGVGEWIPLAEDGQVRPLVMFDEERNPEYPDVPTLRDLGYDIAAPTNLSIAGPAGIPEDRVEILDEAIKEIVETEEFQEIMDNFLMITNYRSHEEMPDFLERVYEQTGEIIRDAGLAEE